MRSVSCMMRMESAWDCSVSLHAQFIHLRERFPASCRAAHESTWTTSALQVVQSIREDYLETRKRLFRKVRYKLWRFVILKFITNFLEKATRLYWWWIMFNIFDDEIQALINCSVFLYAVRVMGKRERANDYVQRRKLISERSVIFLIWLDAFSTTAALWTLSKFLHLIGIFENLQDSYIFWW